MYHIASTSYILGFFFIYIGEGPFFQDWKMKENLI